MEGLCWLRKKIDKNMKRSFANKTTLGIKNCGFQREFSLS